MRFLMLFIFTISFVFSDSMLQKQIEGIKRYGGSTQQPKKEQETKQPKQEAPKAITITHPKPSTPKKILNNALYKPNNLITQRGLEKMARSLGCKLIHDNVKDSEEVKGGKTYGYYDYFDGIPALEIRGKRRQEKRLGAYCVISAANSYRYKETMIHEITHHIDLNLLRNNNAVYCSENINYWERGCEQTARYVTNAIVANDVNIINHYHHKKVADEFVRLYKQTNGIR